MSSLEVRVDKLKEQLSQAGLSVTGEKSIPYGRQLSISDGSSKGNVNIYSGKKGITITVGGAGGQLKEQLENLCAGRSAQAKKPALNDTPGFEHIADFDHRWIGADESGKGDVFGPLVIAAVMVDGELADQLIDLGIRDSKQLTDVKIAFLANRIRELCADKFVELELNPSQYNELYQELKHQGCNLNHMLASAHAQVLEKLLTMAPCHYALIDQFANEQVIQSRLLNKGRQITVVQAPKGERNVAVAAASILARDCFVQSMNQLSETFAITLPKGASTGIDKAIRQFIAIHGKEKLAAVGKLHFRTFEEYC